MLRTHTEHNFASAEIVGDGRWQHPSETRTTEAGSNLPDSAWGAELLDFSPCS